MTITLYTIPLRPQPQTLAVTLGGALYNLRILWNAAANCWVVDISDSNNDLIIGGVALVTGVDLLGQFAYMNFGGQLWVETDFNPLAIPTVDNLGVNSNLYFVVVS